MGGGVRFDSSTRFRPAPNVHTRPLDDSLIILDFARGDYFALDAVGAVVWQQIEGGASLAEIVTMLQSRYDVQETQARCDVTALVEDLLGHALIGIV